MKNYVWDEKTISVVVSGSIRDASPEFDRQAQAFFEAIPTAFPHRQNPFGFAWITGFGVAAAAVLVLFLSLDRSTHDIPDIGNDPGISYEKLITMDDILKDGTGVLAETNLEALRSISWVINNS